MGRENGWLGIWNDGTGKDVTIAEIIIIMTIPAGCCGGCGGGFDSCGGSGSGGGVVG